MRCLVFKLTQNEKLQTCSLKRFSLRLLSEMQKRLLLDSVQIEITIRRLCYQLIENHDDFSNSVIIGLQPRGVFVARRIHNYLLEILKIDSLKAGSLDVLFTVMISAGGKLIHPVKQKLTSW